MNAQQGQKYFFFVVTADSLFFLIATIINFHGTIDIFLKRVLKWCVKTTKQGKKKVNDQ